MIHPIRAQQLLEERLNGRRLLQRGELTNWAREWGYSRARLSQIASKLSCTSQRGKQNYYCSDCKGLRTAGSRSGLCKSCFLQQYPRQTEEERKAKSQERNRANAEKMRHWRKEHRGQLLEYQRRYRQEKALERRITYLLDLDYLVPPSKSKGDNTMRHLLLGLHNRLWELLGSPRAESCWAWEQGYMDAQDQVADWHKPPGY